MDLTFLDFDTSSFIFGAISIGGAWFASYKGVNLSTKKRITQSDNARKDFLKTCEVSYLEWTKKYKDYDEQYALAKSDFELKFPRNLEAGRWRLISSALQLRSHELFKEAMEGMLVILNSLKNEHAAEQNLNLVKNEWENLQDKAKRSSYQLAGLINSYKNAVHTMPKAILSAQNHKASLQERFKNASESVSHIEKTYDPLFWDKIPGAMKKASDAYAAAEEIVATISPDYYYYPDILDNRLNTAETLIRRLENHVDKVINYNNVAHRKADKIRKEMNREWQMRYAGRHAPPAAYKKLLEEARISLMTAETQEYLTGNPEKVFEETIQPYYTLLKALNAK